MQLILKQGSFDQFSVNNKKRTRKRLKKYDIKTSFRGTNTDTLKTTTPYMFSLIYRTWSELVFLLIARCSVTCFSAEQKNKDIFAAEVLHRQISFLPTDRPVQTFIAVT